LEEHRDEIAVLLIDQRMPGEKGVEFLQRARRLHPTAIRILTTAYSDFDAAIEAVNSGAIYKYLSKPWDVPTLEAILRRACEFYVVQRERDLLLKEKLLMLQKMMISDRIQSSSIVATRLAHHVRNSLVALQTFLNLMPEKLREERVDVEQLRNSKFWREFYEQSRNQIRHITELLKDLVVATEKSDSPVRSELHLDKILAQTVEKLNDSLLEKSISILNQVQPGLPSFFGDEEKFQGLFELLLKDEIVRLPGRNQIVLSARARSGKEPELEIEIRDDGPHWPTEAIVSVFDPLSLGTKNPQEFSINLMACHFIVHQYGGRIQVTNHERRGVIFTVTLPLRAKMESLPADEETFIATVLINEAFWQRILAGQN
jgi:two-component system probable response regulator PhcQ